jgi:hypothetical protein
MFFNSFEKPYEKNRNNLFGDYSIMNLQGLRSNPCPVLSLEKTLWGKHEIRHMLASIVVSLKTLYEKT